MKREKKRQHKLLNSSTKKKKNKGAQVSSVHSTRSAPVVLSGNPMNLTKSSEGTMEKTEKGLKPGMMLLVPSQPEMEDEMSAVTISPTYSADSTKVGGHVEGSNTIDESKHQEVPATLTTKVKTPLRDVSNDGSRSSRRRRMAGSSTKSRRRRSRIKREEQDDDDDSIVNEEYSAKPISARKTRSSSKHSSRKARKHRASPSFHQDSDADDELCSVADLPAKSLFAEDELTSHDKVAYTERSGCKCSPDKSHSGHLHPQHSIQTPKQSTKMQSRQSHIQEQFYHMQSPHVMMYPPYNVYHGHGQQLMQPPMLQYHPEDNSCSSQNCQLFSSVAKFITDLFSDPKEKRMFMAMKKRDSQPLQQLHQIHNYPRPSTYYHHHVQTESTPKRSNHGHSLKIRKQHLPRTPITHHQSRDQQSNQKYYHYR